MLGFVPYIPNSEISSVSLKAILLLGITLLFFWLLMLFGRVIKKYRGISATVAMFVNTVIATWLFFEVGSNEIYEYGFTWLHVGKLKLYFGVHIDSLSALFAMIVCFISFLVHLFSIEYLRGDDNFEKYFGYLSLFTFSMLGIIFSASLFQLFIFWELVGFSSYLLIGFWYKNPAAVDANKKAFLVNRVGDAGFLLAILILFSMVGSLQIADLQSFIREIDLSENLDFHYMLQGNIVSKGWLIVAGFGLASGACAKSAQFPFSIWLPYAMEGPTPVSALIHAATMVAAGIYLLARFTFILPDFVLDSLAFLGMITALFASISALGQNDIKRVLAFSTISQLGYMVMAIGVRAYDAALFHLLTHAFFKAALFLCAGAIIYSLHKVDHAYGIKKLYPNFDEQNMRMMGGMRKKMPFIFWVYTIALCGIIGMPFFTGFLSKDAILLSAYNWGMSKGSFFMIVPIVSILSVSLTSFYMLRQYFMVFFGDHRISDELSAPAGMNKFITKEKLEASILMKISPFVLAILTFAPVFSLNPFDGHNSWVYKKLPNVEFLSAFKVDHYMSHWTISIISMILMLFGGVLAYFIYEKNWFYGVKNKIKSTYLFEANFIQFSFNNLLKHSVLVPKTKLSQTFSRFDTLWIGLIPEIFSKSAQKFSMTSTVVDRSGLDKAINKIANSTLIIANITAWCDRNIMDGMVVVFAGFWKMISGFSKYIQTKNVQRILVLTLIILALIISLILIINN